MSELYDLFKSGTRLLEAGDFHAATIPLGRVRELDPDKDSIHEAYGRALFGAHRYKEAAEEFAAIAEHNPTDDYALFCLGRSLQLQGKHAEARAPLAQAVLLKPDRKDYALYRDRAFREAA